MTWKFCILHKAIVCYILYNTDVPTIFQNTILSAHQYKPPHYCTYSFMLVVNVCCPFSFICTIICSAQYIKPYMATNAENILEHSGTFGNIRERSRIFQRHLRRTKYLFHCNVSLVERTPVCNRQNTSLRFLF